MRYIVAIVSCFSFIFPTYCIFTPKAVTSYDSAMYFNIVSLSQESI